MNGAKEMTLVPADEPQVPARVDAGMLPMIERLAAMPDFDVAKLSALLDMQERILNRNAEAAFNAAFAEMQADIPTVIERKTTDKGKYAPREDIVDAIRPVLKKHGFSLSFRTEWPDKATVKVVGILTHREGHARQSEFQSAADTSGSKNAIQALGSAVEYGRRYTTTDLLNIASRGMDDDGERTRRPDPPTDFESWFIDMEAVAQDGIPKLQDAWAKSKKDYREYVAKYMRSEWEELKRKAKRANG